MITDYDNLTIHYEKDGRVVVKELNKIFLQKGVWTTVLYLYCDVSFVTGEEGPVKLGLRRYKKSQGSFRKVDSINISKKSALILTEKISEWFSL